MRSEFLKVLTLARRFSTAMARFRTYEDNDGDDVDFVVFIIHGRSEDWRKVERYINHELEFRTIVLKESYSGKNILEKFKDAIDKSDCAVAILTPDDAMADGGTRARQNVLFEAGYCMASFEQRYEDESDEYTPPVIILNERSIDFKEVSDLLGLDSLRYTNGTIETTFPQLRNALEGVYDDLGGED